MGFRNHPRVVYLFQFYGVVTTNSAVSICWTCITILITCVTIWEAFEVGIFSGRRFNLIIGKTQAFTHSLVLSARLSTQILSLANSKKFKRLLDEIFEVDELIWECFEVEAMTKKSCLKLNLKCVAVVATSSSILLANVFLLEGSGKIYWLWTLSSLHILHVKMLSFVFLIDLFNHRLNTFKNICSKEEVSALALHSKLYTLSKSISRQNYVAMIILLHNCCSLTINSFWIFSIISNTKDEFIVGVYREIYFDFIQLLDELVDTFISEPIGVALTNSMMIFLICKSGQETVEMEKHFASRFRHGENLLDFIHHKIAFKLFGLLNFKRKLIISVWRTRNI